MCERETQSQTHCQTSQRENSQEQRTSQATPLDAGQAVHRRAACASLPTSHMNPCMVSSPMLVQRRRPCSHADWGWGEAPRSLNLHSSSLHILHLVERSVCSGVCLWSSRACTYVLASVRVRLRARAFLSFVVLPTSSSPHCCHDRLFDLTDISSLLHLSPLIVESVPRCLVETSHGGEGCLHSR